MRGLVLDIETVLDRDAVARAGRTGPAAFLRSWLHRVAAVSTLGFEWHANSAQFGAFTLETALALEPEQEVGIFSFVEERLAPLDATDVLITFNGTAHDLPVLRNRRLAWWLFGPSRVAALVSLHHDVMHLFSQDGVQRWPGLVDMCAGMGIPCNAALAGRGPSRLNPLLVKGQTDVCGTFLIYLMWQARQHAAPAILTNGWTTFADHLLQIGPTQPHLTQFVTAPRAILARKSVGDVKH